MGAPPPSAPLYDFWFILDGPQIPFSNSLKLRDMTEKKQNQNQKNNNKDSRWPSLEEEAYEHSF